jgi:hypothetical protein
MADVSAVFAVKWTNGEPVLSMETLASLQGSGWRLLGDPADKTTKAVLVTTSKAQMDALKLVPGGNATPVWNVNGTPDPTAYANTKTTYGFNDKEYTALMAVVK